MKISELDLPSSLYTEITDRNGARTRLVVPDKLLAWAQEDGGDAIVRLCRGSFEKSMASIQAWEAGRILQLEEQVRNAGKDELTGSRNFRNVRHYHTTREAIVREAERKRAGAMEQMLERRSAIEQLVEEARSYVFLYRMQHDRDDILHYLLLLGTLALAIYSLFN